MGISSAVSSKVGARKIAVRRDLSFPEAGRGAKKKILKVWDDGLGNDDGEKITITWGGKSFWVTARHRLKIRGGRRRRRNQFTELTKRSLSLTL